MDRYIMVGDFENNNTLEKCESGVLVRHSDVIKLLKKIEDDLSRRQMLSPIHDENILFWDRVQSIFQKHIKELEK